ncbi:protein FAM102A [Strongylocentrotus purpuratus]|uniref:C2 NT-type domain-containing protein n=1 Tax=Strongylocentrotus purpuratus TaxID=7668 RepID=A0A7M7PNM8_STRPU|nr:protein FAM102A [Strongylocentrotus purpuratus]XP_030852949.1 protein FAM102A [Strongylocentrotus purpuratus]|eukprot:XP_003724897.1 PREDICTED: protein FAM102A [Strongylocentrotus purpuratus]
MTFIMKKKKFKFQVNFELVELSSVPLINAVLFGKVRLQDGGNFAQVSSREEIQDHVVHWGSKFSFNCRMSANANTGILEPCSCRVSIRKEVKGGKSYTKCGFVDINLAEFAGAGSTSRRYLLEGYDSKNRQDNSTLKVNIVMVLMSGDPCFKAPDFKQHTLPCDMTAETLLIGNLSVRNGDELTRGGSIASSSTSSNSTRSKGSKHRPNVLTSGLVSPVEPEPRISEESFELGHSRSSSYNSQQSRASGYSSAHSASSGGFTTEHFSSATSLTDLPEKEQMKDAWRGTGTNERRRKHAEAEESQRRLDNTRVDADEVIQGIINQQDFQADEMSGEEGLQLYIARDGSTALGSQQLKNRMSAGTFEPVVIDQR